MSMIKAKPQTIEAVYEHGAFKPLHPEDIDLSEGQKVSIVVERRLTPKEMSELAGSVYDGLPEEDIDEIERIALDRSNFFGRRES
jgi:predicted DNA-binding antitoxin AbrB/MazE fold protein